MKLNQNGSVIVPILIAVSVLFVASLVFGLWAFSGRQKYKNDTDSLINTAVTNAKAQQESADASAFFVKQENPLIEWVGPEAYGTINLWYPKNWNAYVNVSGSNGFPVDSYFYPGVLPSVSDGDGVNFALRLQVENEPYSQILENYQNEVQRNLATVSAYSLPKVPSVVGIEVVGELASGISGTLVILPLRTEALEAWTEGSAYLSQFNQYILPNLSFSP